MDGIKMDAAAFAATFARRPVNSDPERKREQNRIHARKSRRKKKKMIEELQLSIVSFQRANEDLKQQNKELTKLLFEAQTKVGGTIASSGASSTPDVNKDVTTATATAPVEITIATAKNSDVAKQAQETQSAVEDDEDDKKSRKTQDESIESYEDMNGEAEAPIKKKYRREEGGDLIEEADEKWDNEF